ncbi:NAD(P)H-binding protein [Herbaspirillum sp. LeCh32-8]|uniref:SDR family oxidoreductase n=1 Tax=Herbaspirillum sp. LeCh32-8 TaxID=2821356 RepID=UPI001AE4AA07|nr:NAD(P)H-binding protein [Herbaspirillum sp. LeCh32-8]MBP0596661.1 NAD(P)H-binding protein [Herbaspirillum sp. LeCh32-8]
MNQPHPAARPRVVVAGANSQTGRLLLLLLRDSGMHATALVRQPARLVADEVISDWTNNPHSAEAIAAADAVVLLTGVVGADHWAAYEHGMVDTARQVAQAVGARDTRVVYFSSLLADAGSENWYLRAKGMAEDVLRVLPGSVIFRLGPVVRGSPQPLPFEQALLQQAPDAPVVLYGEHAEQRTTRPINLGDVATIAESAALGMGKAGIYELAGPEEHSLAQLARLANGGDVAVRSAPLQTLACPVLQHSVRDLLARIAAPRDAGAPAATAAAFGLRLTPLSLAWPLDAPEPQGTQEAAS